MVCPECIKLTVLIFFEPAYGQVMPNETNLGIDAPPICCFTESESSLEKKIAAIVDKLTPKEGLFPEEVSSDWISWELSNVGGFF